eukprot:242413-Chlamydomonas_euryale.AAC.1
MRWTASPTQPPCWPTRPPCHSATLLANPAALPLSRPASQPGRPATQPPCWPTLQVPSGVDGSSGCLDDQSGRPD